MKRTHLIITIALLALSLAALVAVAVNLQEAAAAPPVSTGGFTPTSTGSPTAPVDTQSTTAPTTMPTQPPTQPPVIKQTTATIGATGDILMHDLLISSGYDSATGTYHYDDIFPFFSDYVNQVDYAVANLEVTLCGSDNGYPYDGYPCFNCPDAIVDALKNAGFDLLLTANNHAYDTRSTGFIRTQQVIDSLGLQHIGTRLEESAPNYTLVDVNGIRIGMINYTYNTGLTDDGRVTLNGIPLSSANSTLVNSFDYNDLDAFYSKLSGELQAMKEEGAEAIVLYIHWGDEYNTTPNRYQTAMAQQLCNLGIDVIVGNHAHVPQPVVLLTSQADENQKTLCLYSTGNSVSNIYKTSRFPVNTEDGMLFNFTFAKYSDGTVVVESAQILPTWVLRYDDEQGVRKFRILTLDPAIEDWKAHLGISDSVLAKCQASYARTMDIVGSGLDSANAWFAQNQEALENALGVQ